MDDITVVPSHIGVGTTEHDGKRLGLLVVTGSSTDGRLKVNVVIDQPTLGELVAALDLMRADLVRATIADGKATG